MPRPPAPRSWRWSAAIAAARAQPGFAEIVTTVDAPNAASRRVLETLGFQPVATRRGAVGDIVMLRLSGPCR